ncbi:MULTISPECIES: type II toxin-antitoxin system prevent-host-death family antitoxin [unclassified Synechococcus]|uniref:type II toxin-antitoxin system prevent-host-death family antitoxin n=1 Tax=unclassified Synechococcus TaxID=2626047 RepID=UPI0020CEF4A7|nr:MULTISPECIES: type II toxin-antitoxin system prevent-host-death family antitoxin [unclassified Synechococcus]
MHLSRLLREVEQRESVTITVRGKAVADLVPSRTDPASPLETTERITSLGRSFQLSSHNASYLELALRLGSGLASFDRALLAAAAAAGVAVYD